MPDNNSPSSNENSASPKPVSPPNSVLIPAAPPPESKQSDPSDVVVPTLEKQDSPTNNQPQNDQKLQPETRLK